MDARNQLSPYALAALLAGIAASSCSKVNDMHDATMQMAGTTQHMAASTDKLGDNTAQLKEGTDQLKALMSQILDSARQGAAVDLRRNYWDELMKADQLESKGGDACIFFQSFEYQLWSGIGLDSYKNERLRLTQDAAEEFFTRLAGIAHWAPNEIDPFAGVMPSDVRDLTALFSGGLQALLSKPFKPSDVDNEKESFNALALTLEKKNREEELAPSSPTDELSMIGLIETALAANQKIKAGKAKLSDYPAYVNLILQNEELATRLLRARVQMATAAPLCKLTAVCQDLGQGAKYILEKQEWNMDFSQLNVAEVEYSAFYLGEAIKARDFLAALGIQEKLDDRILQLYSQRIVAHAPSAEAAAAGDEKAQAAVKMLAELKELTGK